MLVRQRTQSVNHLRAFALELGLVAPKSRASLMRLVPEWLEDGDNGLSESARALLWAMYEQLRGLEDLIAGVDDRLKLEATKHPACARLQTMRGVGPVIATGLVAALGDGSAFRNGRAVGAWLGLVPGHEASGESYKETGITKQGNPELRALLVHGARSAINSLGDRSDPVSEWARRLLERSPRNKATVALANKMARMMWAMLRHEQNYRYA